MPTLGTPFPMMVSWLALLQWLVGQTWFSTLAYFWADTNLRKKVASAATTRRETEPKFRLTRSANRALYLRRSDPSPRSRASIGKQLQWLTMSLENNRREVAM